MRPHFAVPAPPGPHPPAPSPKEGEGEHDTSCRSTRAEVRQDRVPPLPSWGRGLGGGGLVLAVALLLSACGPSRRSEPLAGPLTLEDPVLVQGEQTFARYCAACHPRGEAGLGPALNDKPLPEWMIRFQVRNGLGVMPRFSREQISDPELDAVVRYLKELRRQQP